MATLSRTQERTMTMQALYSLFLFVENKQDFDATEIIVNQFGVENFEKIPTYSQVVYSFAVNNLEEIIALISKYLINWTFSRLDNVAKAILVLAVTEGNYCHLAPRKVVINQAVELAKEYLKDGDHKFINAVLDKAIEKYEFSQKQSS